MKVKVIKAEQQSYWYADKIGEEFIVKEDIENPDSYTLLDDWHYIQKDDCQPISWGIDGHWDNVECSSTQTKPPDYYQYPATKPVVVKKSVEQLAVDVLQNTTGKVYTEREIIAIVNIVNSIKGLEG